MKINWRHGWPYVIRHMLPAAWAMWRTRTGLGLWWSVKFQWGLAWEVA